MKERLARMMNQDQQVEMVSTSPYDAARALLNFTRNTSGSSSSAGTEDLALRTPATPMTPQVPFPIIDPATMMWMQPAPQMMMPFMMQSQQQMDFNRQFELFMMSWSQMNAASYQQPTPVSPDSCHQTVEAPTPTDAPAVAGQETSSSVAV